MIPVKYKLLRIITFLLTIYILGNLSFESWICILFIFLSIITSQAVILHKTFNITLFITYDFLIDQLERLLDRVLENKQEVVGFFTSIQKCKSILLTSPCKLFEFVYRRIRPPLNIGQSSRKVPIGKSFVTPGINRAIRVMSTIAKKGQSINDNNKNIISNDLCFWVNLEWESVYYASKYKVVVEERALGQWNPGVVKDSVISEDALAEMGDSDNTRIITVIPHHSISPQLQLQVHPCHYSIVVIAVSKEGWCFCRTETLVLPMYAPATIYTLVNMEIPEHWVPIQVLESLERLANQTSPYDNFDIYPSPIQLLTQIIPTDRLGYSLLTSPKTQHKAIEILHLFSKYHTHIKAISKCKNLLDLIVSLSGASYIGIQKHNDQCMDYLVNICVNLVILADNNDSRWFKRILYESNIDDVLSFHVFRSVMATKALCIISNIKDNKVLKYSKRKSILSRLAHVSLIGDELSQRMVQNLAPVNEMFQISQSDTDIQ